MLGQYTEQATTELMEANGAFFAFSNDQYKKASQEGVEYVSMGLGLIAPKENADKIHAGLEEIHVNGIKKLMEDHDREEIIRYELSNYECYYTDDPSDAIDVVKCYGITAEEVKKVFIEERQKKKNNPH